MPSYYKDGARYPINPSRSVARFGIHAMGVPVVRGTLTLNDGLLVIDAAGGIRSANFSLSAGSTMLEAPVHSPVPADLFGGPAHPLIEFETQWARQVGTHHGLDGVLRMHGQAHVFTLRAEPGVWASDACPVIFPALADAAPISARAQGSDGVATRSQTTTPPAPKDAATPQAPSEWYRGIVGGILDRRAWELEAHTLAEAALTLLGHDIHFEVQLCAGPQVVDPASPATNS